MTSAAIGTTGTATVETSSRLVDLVERHTETLEGAVAAIRDRGHWSAYPESPSPRHYGADALTAGRAAFEAHLGGNFELDLLGVDGWVGGETSPFGFELGVTYPHAPAEALLAAAKASQPKWRATSPEIRVSVCAEIVSRINERSFEIAHAVMHTSGQAFVMAFQAGGPHAQDRALEAIAYAYAEQTRIAATAIWDKPQGSKPSLRMEKRYTVVPRGIALVIGCSTFPTWNSYPGLFASLATGNPVIVKPHPAAILPLAISVSIARAVLSEFGFASDLVTLAVERPGERLAAELATRPDVAIVDFTGSSAFGDWLEENARQARVYTEKAGVNTVIIESTDDYAGLLTNLAFSLALYSGQMCTAPQNLLIPCSGIATDTGHKTVVEVAADLGAAINRTLGTDDRAVELLGAIVSDNVLTQLDAVAARAATHGRIVVPSRPILHPDFPKARVRTPLVVVVDVTDTGEFGTECFGPMSFIVTAPDAEASVELFRQLGLEHGALTASVYSTDSRYLEVVRNAALEVGVALSENLTAGVFVNQSAAFSDFHGSGANPATNASYTDADFVTGRFRFVQSRRHLPSE
jgi:phenylacetic acid degradation protein paaN